MTRGRFVDRLRREHHASARAAPEAHRLHYVLWPGEHRLRLALRVGRPEPNGRLADPQPYRLQPAHLAQAPPFLDATDTALLDALARHDSGWLGSAEGELPTALAVDWLRRAVSTGRACDTAGRALAWAEPIACDGAWVADADGHQHWRWQLPDGMQVAAAVPPVFWDALQRRLGALETPYPSAAEAWLAQTPAIAPDETGDFRARHAAQLAAWGLALPAHIPLREIAPAPEPRLDLMGASDGAPDERLCLRFRYAHGATATLFDLAEPASQRCLYAEAAGERLRVARDHDAEARLAQQARSVLGPYGVREIAAGIFSLPDATAWQTAVIEAVPALQRAGWQLATWPGFRYRFVRPEAVSMEARWLDRGWLDLALHVDIDGESVALLPLLTTGRQRYSLATLQAADPGAEYPLDLADGRRLLVPARRLARWLAALDELDEAAAEAPRIRLPEAQVDRLAQLADDETRMSGDTDVLERAQARRAPATLSAFHPPPRLAAHLRGYQRLGVAWLQQRQRLGTGGVLADDMGLGKTLQVLAHIAAEREQGRLTRPALIVAPTSVLASWHAEAERFCPELAAAVLHGPRRHRLWDQLDRYDVLVTSYGLLARDRQRWQSQPLAMAVLDEAQAIRNPRAGISRCVRELDAPVRLCLTGTPLQNHLGELWALLDCVMPGMLDTERRFNRRYRRPIEDDGDGARRAALMERIAPFVLRRRKDEVATDLPDKSEITVRVPLSDDQRARYEDLRARGVARLQAQRDAGETQAAVHTLNLIMELRQLCCDPRLIDRTAQTDSAKRAYLLSMLAELTAAGRAILVFSQFRSMLEYIAADLRAAGIDYTLLTGETRERGRAVERFQRGEVAVFLVSLKAGGTGLNLTRADTVIHYDPWWNSAAEDQATDRAHRIGQQHPVFVYRLLAADTVEEKVHALQQHKRQLLAEVYSAAESQSAQLGRDHPDLMRLLED